MIRYLFLPLLFLANYVVAGSASTNSRSTDPLKKIVKEIAKANIYEATPVVGYAGTPSLQNKRYQQLLKSADISTLTRLATNNRNAIVRLYAFKALVNVLKDIPVSIVEQFKNDSTVIVVLQGDIAREVPLKSIASGFLY